MEVLFVTGEFPPMQGGVGDYTRELGLALVKAGSHVHVLTSTRGGPVEGLAVHPTIQRWNWGCWRTIRDLVAEHQPDVVHVQYQAAAYSMHPAINLLPRRLRLDRSRPTTVVTFHDLKVPYLFPKAGPLRRRAILELASRSDGAITTNRHDFEELERQLGAAPALIPIGSNITPHLPAGYDRDGWRARWGSGPGDLLLCYFGFVNDRKGVDTLLHALRELATDPEGPSNPQLLMIGGQTGASDPTNVAYLQTIQSLVAELDLVGRVHSTGYVSPEEVSASFEAADICVLPFRDGVSFLHGTLQAALAHGSSIITTRPPLNLPELEDGENILLVPPEEPGVLAGAIRELAAAPKQRDRLGAGARALSELFRWDRIAADTLALYDSLRAAAQK